MNHNISCKIYASGSKIRISAHLIDWLDPDLIILNINLPIHQRKIGKGILTSSKTSSAKCSLFSGHLCRNRLSGNSGSVCSLYSRMIYCNDLILLNRLYTVHGPVIYGSVRQYLWLFLKVHIHLILIESILSLYCRYASCHQYVLFIDFFIEDLLKLCFINSISDLVHP